MTFILLCAGLLIFGGAKTIDVSGKSFYNYMPQPHSHFNLKAIRRNVYSDGGQYQLTLASDHKRVWVQLDTDDNPHDRGDELKCNKIH
jgi:hypothetical protein